MAKKVNQVIGAVDLSFEWNNTSSVTIQNLGFTRELNRDYAVGFKAPFMFQGADTREKSRNYYRTYVPLFKLQLKKDYLFQVFKEIAKTYKDIYEEEKRQYHQSMNNDDSVDFEEAVRLVRRHGYIVD